MDTRAKIIDAAQAARIAQSGATVVSGYFDPLVASCAGQLAALKQDDKPLLVLIADPPDPILPALARAQLVASLAVVDYVSVNAGGIPAVALESQHAAQLADLIRHVHSRQEAAS